jgi:hypothetical protein
MTHSDWTCRLGLVLIAVATSACIDAGEDDGVSPIQPGAAEITTDITASRTFHAETTYTLSGFVHVREGATLTIEAGTKIVGDYDVPGSSLMVLPGARLRAMGTAEKPIVFTSERPAGLRQAGDWGGLILVGRGIINRGSPTILEGTGTGASNPEVNYGGGTDNTDSSGELHYVRVEFAGYATATDAELNSFTFAAVGSGTQLDHLQSLYGLDDAFEWFGGAVDAKYLVSYEAGDDHFDISEGYVGRLQHLIAYQSVRVIPRAAAGSPSTDPQGIENDGCNGQNCSTGQNSQPYTVPMIANFTLVGTGPGVVDATSGGIGMMLRRGTGGYYVNGVVARWPRAAVSLRDQPTLDRTSGGQLVLQSVYFAENGPTFQAASGTTVQGTLDLSSHALEIAAGTTTTGSLFAKAPPAVPGSAADIDWSLTGNSAARAGGISSFTGALAAKAGGFVLGTAYRGAADPNGAKWWEGWTAYARN